MAKITSVADLEKIKKGTLDQMSQSKDFKVVVGMGTCGISAGAEETMKALEEEINERGLSNVVLTITGCIGLCVQEPLVEVHKPGKEKMVFKLVDAERAKEIVEQYLINDLVNKDWVVN